MQLNLRLLIIVLGLLVFVSSGQDSTKQNISSKPPGNILILDGYEWEAGIGKDAETGKISNREGFTIQFVRSAVKNFYSKQFAGKGNIKWLKHQRINEQQLDLALFNDDEIVALFDNTTRFSAKPRSFAQLTDFLLTVMTFNAGENVAVNPSTTTVPGNIKLLEGYVYERRRGIDSHVGALVRNDGFTIGHDIGKMASNYADQYFPEHFERLRKQTHLNSEAIESQIKYLQNKIEWRQRQKMNGNDVMVVLPKDSMLIAAFSGYSANFMSKVDSSDKVADFFLTVLTFRPISNTSK